MLWKNVNSDLCVKDPINHLDEIFLREPRFKSFARGIKESFTGTETERRNMKQSVDAIKALGGLAKAKLSGDESSMEAAKANMKDTIVSTVNLASGNRLKYKEIADSVEKEFGMNNKGESIIWLKNKIVIYIIVVIFRFF